MEKAIIYYKKLKSNGLPLIYGKEEDHNNYLIDRFYKSF